MNGKFEAYNKYKVHFEVLVGTDTHREYISVDVNALNEKDAIDKAESIAWNTANEEFKPAEILDIAYQDIDYL